MFERGLRLLALAAAIVVFGTAGFSQSVDGFANDIKNGTTEQKREAIFQLRNFRSAEASLAAVPALSDPDPIIRASAAAAVIYLDEAETAKFLVPLLSDSDEFVRREAAYALAENGAANAVTELIRMVRNERTIETKNAAAIALGSTRSSAAVAVLTDILRKKPNEDNEFTRRSAARSIGRLALSAAGRDPEKTVTPQNFLPKKFKDTSAPMPAERAAIFDAAAKVLAEVLQRRAESGDTRREAAFALGAIANGTARNALAAAAENTDDPYLSEIAREGLLNIAKQRENESPK